MNEKPLKLGFIGGGLNSAVGTTHKIASQMDGRWILEAGCFSRHEELNTKTSECWGIVKDRLYRTPEQLLIAEKGKLDALVILTPTPSHLDLIIKAIEQGFNIISEKSLVSCYSDAEKIHQKIKKHRNFLAVTYNYTGYPMIRELQSLIKTGVLGTLNQIHIEMPQEGFERLDVKGKTVVPQAWRLNDQDIPVISLDLGVHLVQMIHFLSHQDPVELVATQSTYGHFKGVIDDVKCIAEYTGNLSCQIWYSKTALGHSNGLKVRVYGNHGSAEWLQTDPEVLVLNNQQGVKQLMTRASIHATESSKLSYNRFKAGHPSGFIEAFANHYNDLADSLIAFRETSKIDSPWVFGIESAKQGLLMLEVITKSAEKKSWLAVKNVLIE